MINEVFKSLSLKVEDRKVWHKVVVVVLKGKLRIQWNWPDFGLGKLDLSHWDWNFLIANGINSLKTRPVEA